MLLKSNLRLLLAQLDSLSETPYFSSQLDIYIRELREALRSLLSKAEAQPIAINKDLARFIANEVWRLTQFLTGSTTKQIPYEVVYAIEKAAAEWSTRRLLITTAIVQEANFYFHSSSRDFFDRVEQELGIKISHQPVQIALPYIYRHKPLFCVPLFHELGHFIDTSNDVVTTSLLSHPEYSGPDLPNLPPSSEIAKKPDAEKQFFAGVVRNHRAEYFADLVSAAYVGEAAHGFLEEFIPNQNASESHPSSVARYQLMSDFISGNNNPILDMFQEVLKVRGLPPLSARFQLPDVDDSFGNVRPCKLESDAGVFGIFAAGWVFLTQMNANPSGVWSSLSKEDAERVTNDLVEKSIRNRMIAEGWDEATNP